MAKTTGKKPTLREAVQKADRRAKLRDARVRAARREKAPNLAVVDAEEAKAQAMVPKHTIVKIRDKNRAAFTQLVNENFRYLMKRDYLTTAEEAFMLRLMTLVELNSNALVMFRETEDGYEKIRGAFPKVTELAEIMNMSVYQVRRLVNQLIRKGILYEFVDTETLKKYGRPIEERPLFFNPEIVFAGDKNRINLTLCRLHWQNDRLEKQGLKLPWKIWYTPNEEHGRLYRRKTWLKKRKMAEKMDKKYR